MQRHALAILFTALAAALAAVGAFSLVGAHAAGRWVIGAAAIALAAWMATLAVTAARGRR